MKEKIFTSSLYYPDYEAPKPKEKIDYGKLSDIFNKNNKKPLTKKEKAAILNKIIGSDK